MRVIVCGSRSLRDASVVRERLERFAQSADGCCGFTLVHGACPSGADLFAREWAVESRWQIHIDAFPADWGRLGRSAGMVRNKMMAEAGADLCIAFWDGKSPGTFDMIRAATRHHIPVEIVPVRT